MNFFLYLCARIQKKIVMKRILCVFALIAMMCMSLGAAPRSLQQARKAAPGMRHVHTAMLSEGQPAFYVFDRPNEGGYQIISADDRAFTVLGYTDRGHWDEKDLPENLQEWLAMFTEEMSEISDAYAPQQTKSYSPVDPLCSTIWNQKAPYNNLCPTWQSKRCLTGCTAIAASQIMKKHNYPAQGIGSASYKWANENGDSVTLSADFGSTTYQWADMLDSYDGNPTDAQIDAVSTLIYQAGVAANLTYGPSATGGNSHYMVQMLIDHFGYDKGIRTYRRGYIHDSVIQEAIYTDLQAGRPVYFSAKTPEGYGHAFVCDGIDADGLLHINWGWGGKSNGYFRLSATAPIDSETGAIVKDKNYTRNVKIFTQIRPDAGSEYSYTFTVDSLRLWYPVVHRDSVVALRLDTFYNQGFTDWTGNLCIVIYKDGQVYKRRTASTDRTLQPGHRANKFNYGINFSNRTTYPEGEYEFVVSARAVGYDNQVFPIYCKGVGEWRCQMTITTDSIYLTPPTAVIPVPGEAVEQTQFDPAKKAQKIWRDGQILIECEDKIYNTLGQTL